MGLDRRRGRVGRQSRRLWSGGGFCCQFIAILDISCYSTGMNISLTAQLESFVHSKVESGLYSSASEVVREALRLLREKDELRQTRFMQLRQEVQLGITELAGSEVVDDTLEQVAEQVKGEGRVRRGTRKRSA